MARLGGVWPNWVFPLVWISPLLLITGLPPLLKLRGYLHPVTQGRWEVVALPALAAFFCGGLWEMWNYYAWPKWIYIIPFVQQFSLFEMPILGYGGYLPFGVTCVAVADLVDFKDGHSSE